MPTLEYRKESATAVKADAVAVFATKDDGRAEPAADAAAAGRALGVDLAEELAGIRFEGDVGAVARIPTRGAAKARLLLVVGLGARGSVTLEVLRRAAGAAPRQAAKDSTLAVVVPADVLPDDTGHADAAQAVAEGAGLGAYAYTRYRSKPHDTPSLDSLLILPGQDTDAGEVKRGVGTGDVFVRATCLTRDLVNTPPFAKRPPALADRIAEVGKQAGVKVRVLDEHALTDGGFGGVLGVGQGSSAPPRLVELTYAPLRARGHVILVGKGITFDSGGLSLKPTSGMATMKSDMAGAAAVVGAVSALKELGLRTKVTGLVALAENMPSGDAIRVSDVLTHYGGKTVEVMNTDAEGRLVLADALAYAVEQRPDAIVDVATLTGAQIVALGSKIAGLMGSDDALVDELEAAARRAGERVWHLPLPDEYTDHLKSEVADLKNIGKGREAGTLTAGLFLKEFTGDVPWAHLDVAGPAFSEDGDNFYTPKGGTGMPVRTLLRFLTSRAQGS